MFLTNTWRELDMKILYYKHFCCKSCADWKIIREELNINIQLFSEIDQMLRTIPALFKDDVSYFILIDKVCWNFVFVISSDF